VIVKQIFKEMWPSIWPMMTFISVLFITLRIAHLSKSNKKIIFHKEILSLIFIIYILCLYYILMYQTNEYDSINLIPFEEILTYPIGSSKFINYTINNIILFIPFGFYSSYYINNKNTKICIITTLIVSLSIELMQYYINTTFNIDNIILNVLGGILGYLLFICFKAIESRLPKFMKSDNFINFILITIIILIVLFSLGINIFSYI